MKPRAILLAGICASAISVPAYAQDTTGDNTDTNVIIVTAQRQAQSLQEVPIAVSAFDAEALEAQQIDNASDLQLTLPNVSFTKGNFTSSSFTIRGIGDLCVGTSCDAATGIHTNGSPLFGTRLFETEYFDLERIEVLRGPQGTLFGRNATSGVVNIVTAKPQLGEFGASAEFEYGNYDSKKAKAMLNVPLGDTLAFRAAGFYLNRDGYTTNTFNGDKIDNRDMYAVRASLRWEPTVDTTVDLMGFYFHENDNRMRIQKQLCQRDPNGILGCLNNRRDADTTNFNSTFVGTLGSREFLTIATGNPVLGGALGLNSLYGPDLFSAFQQSADVREVGTAFTPEYFADEKQAQLHIDQNLGSMKLSVTGIYQETSVDSREDYWLAIGRRDTAQFQTALNTLQVFANFGIPTGLPAPAPAFVPGSSAYFQPIYEALTPDGPNGQLCVSDTSSDNRGAYEGNKNCFGTPASYDRSASDGSSWSAEALLSSDFDGPFNFLVGAIYADAEATDTDYYVNAFGIDYVAGVLGTLTAFGGGLAPSYLASSFYRNNTSDFRLKSYGLFGEAYFDVSDTLKFTAGVRYNNDKKSLTARTALAAFLNPFSNDGDPFATPYGNNFDADPGSLCTPASPVGAVGSRDGCEAFQERSVGFDAITGRAVIDWQVSPDSLIYASYSRGYKSGGINPPLSPIFEVSESFGPESLDAYEIGSKNTLLNGALQVNATAFYYNYGSLQLSRIIARTSVNDTIDAKIWGVELETIIRPSEDMLINANFSYLNAEVAGDQFFSNPRDPGGGDPNAVIIKDISNGALCAVTGPAPGAAAAFVTAFNGALGLQGPVSFPDNSGIASQGAFSICDALRANAPAGFQVLSPGVEVNIKGNKLPQAPELKASVGAQYTFLLGSGATIVPRFDISLTGTQYGNVFNGNVNRIDPFVQANAQIQFNSADDHWFVRGFVQNIFDSNATTGLYVTDASSGLFTNIFTLDPRRYGISVGAKF